MEEIYKYKTLAEAAAAEYKDRGSRFMAFAYSVNAMEDIKGKLQLLKKEHAKAAHHCFAFRIGTDGSRYRANDDGEPPGTAGKPILGQIDSAGLTNVLVVVVRYFGGTLLGVPGLINAYKSVTTAALQSAAVIEKWIEQLVEITFDYPGMSEVLYLLKQSDATIYQQDLQLFCKIQAGIPLIYIHEYLPRLSEIRGVTVTQMKAA